MTIDTLRRLQQWYASRCNGDWEHESGVRIDTLDNPGWHCVIDLVKTPLEGVAFTEVRKERTDFDWVLCRVYGGKFEGLGGPGNLAEILTVFLEWAEVRER